MFRRRWVRGLFYVAGTFIFLKIKDNFSALYRLGRRCGDADGFIVLLPPCMIDDCRRRAIRHTGEI